MGSRALQLYYLGQNFAVRQPLRRRKGQEMVRNCPDSKTWEKVRALLLQKWKLVSIISCLGLIAFRINIQMELIYVHSWTKQLLSSCVLANIWNDPPIPNRCPLRHFHLDGSLVIVDQNLCARTGKIPVKRIHIEDVFVGVRRGISPCDRPGAKSICFVLIRFKADLVTGFLCHPRNLANGCPCRPEKRALKVNNIHANKELRT